MLKYSISRYYDNFCRIIRLQLTFLIKIVFNERNDDVKEGYQ